MSVARGRATASVCRRLFQQESPGRGPAIGMPTRGERSQPRGVLAGAQLIHERGIATLQQFLDHQPGPSRHLAVSRRGELAMRLRRLRPWVKKIRASLSAGGRSSQPIASQFRGDGSASGPKLMSLPRMLLDQALKLLFSFFFHFSLSGRLVWTYTRNQSEPYRPINPWRCSLTVC
jgi:hypothetical protein